MAGGVCFTGDAVRRRCLTAGDRQRAVLRQIGSRDGVTTMEIADNRAGALFALATSGAAGPAAAPAVVVSRPLAGVPM